MHWTTRLVATSGFALLLLGSTAACGLLDASDPTAIEESELANGEGANLLRREAMKSFYQLVSISAFAGGLLTDEVFADPPSWNPNSPDKAIDSRQQSGVSGPPGGFYDLGQQTRRYATSAIDQIRAYGGANVKNAYIGQMFVIRGYAELGLADNFCPGFPLNTVVDGRMVYDGPRTTAQVFEAALADFDSAIAYAVDSARILAGARVGRARALLELGRFAEAAAAASAVDTSFAWSSEHTAATGQANALVFSNRWRSVADQEGGVGLDYVSASDPRVVVTALGPAVDGVTVIYGIAKYPNTDAPIVLGSGIEARLVQAEAALNADDADWLTILNELRANNVTPSLPALTDPGTADARVDLLFRERAFWLFATGHRLGDLRRLIRLYDRDPETVFPTGAYRLGGPYGGATSYSFNAESEAAGNPAITGCTGS